MITNDKAIIRKEMLEKRRALSKDECRVMSETICRRFLETDEYRNADTILLYKAYNNEVITDLIFEQAAADGKKVAYPLSKIADGEPVMTFYVTEDIAQLQSGYKGIMEPDITKHPEPFEGSADICITPGVAFDRKCHRIGYGKAFYDRYIRLNAPRKVIGLAYEMQIADDFRPEDTDRSVDMVITEKTVYRK